MSLSRHGTSPRNFEHETADSMILAIRSEPDVLSKSYNSIVLVGHLMGGTLCTLIAMETNVGYLVPCAPDTLQM